MNPLRARAALLGERLDLPPRFSARPRTRRPSFSPRSRPRRGVRARDRAAALDRKLELIGSTVRIVLALVAGRRSLILEAAVVALIAIELGSGFDQLGSGFDQLGSGFDQLGSGFDQLGSG